MQPSWIYPLNWGVLVADAFDYTDLKFIVSLRRYLVRGWWWSSVGPITGGTNVLPYHLCRQLLYLRSLDPSHHFMHIS